MSRSIRFLIAVFLLTIFLQFDSAYAQIPPGLRAGLRASNYGITPFPSPTWWVNSISSMSARFPGSTKEQVAVVVEVLGGGGKHKCWAHFPNPTPSVTWPGVVFD